MKKRERTADIIPVLVKCLLAVWAISGDSLSLMLTAYPVDVPVVKQILMLLEFLDGWGLENLFMALGLGAVFYLVRDRQKNVWVSGLSAFFSVCTVIGISYGKTGSWDCIFLYGMQFALAVFVAVGLFLFTFPQFICQCLVFAHALWTMSKIKTPVLFRWSALVFWAVLPYFPLWGYTMVKDTSYYIAILLLTVLLTDVLSGKGRITWRRYVLMAADAAVIRLKRPLLIAV